MDYVDNFFSFVLFYLMLGLSCFVYFVDVGEEICCIRFRRKRIISITHIHQNLPISCCRRAKKKPVGMEFSSVFHLNIHYTLMEIHNVLAFYRCLFLVHVLYTTFCIGVEWRHTQQQCTECDGAPQRVKNLRSESVPLSRALRQVRGRFSVIPHLRGVFWRLL